ncbi:hypothetical protein IEI94_13650 [Halomonas sp. ML-15]|uniref:hypothetical protein n=1 Tax=Halomonas sp. ML-15 TaxID=2773305 RepID=UPI001747961D|nr:hypothetical protein [Halomonas sp. ML-15]MBD3896898.1 hypothetical protein [Halomonas sp. ML-15]
MRWTSLSSVTVGGVDAVENEGWERISKLDFAAELDLDGGTFSQAVTSGAAFDFYYYIHRADVSGYQRHRVVACIFIPCK